MAGLLNFMYLYMRRLSRMTLFFGGHDQNISKHFYILYCHFFLFAKQTEKSTLNP